MLRFFILFTYLFFFAACNIQQPGVDNPRALITGFTHTGQETTCLTCHEQNRPTPEHGQNKDCIICHSPKDGWKKATAFSHNPVPQSCTQCHSEKRPTTSTVMKSRNSNNPDQSHFVKNDCVSCHQVPLDQATAWTFKHQNAQANMIQFCLPCHESDGLRKHSTSTGFFDQAGRCQECHSSLTTWDREGHGGRD